MAGLGCWMFGFGFKNLRPNTQELTPHPPYAPDIMAHMELRPPIGHYTVNLLVLMPQAFIKDSCLLI